MSAARVNFHLLKLILKKLGVEKALLVVKRVGFVGDADGGLRATNA